MSYIATDHTSQENAERLNERLLALLDKFHTLEATTGTIAHLSPTKKHTAPEGLTLEAMLKPGKDLVIQDTEGDVLFYMRWYPYTTASENLQFLPKGIFPQTILAADDTGLWFYAVPEGSAE